MQICSLTQNSLIEAHHFYASVVNVSNPVNDKVSVFFTETAKIWTYNSSLSREQIYSDAELHLYKCKWEVYLVC